MDKEIKEIMDRLENAKVGLDEEFRFHCTQCGECCRHRDDILLNPKDVYNMSKELKIDTRELIEKYCDSYVGSNSRIPVVRLQPRGSVQRCPMLKYGKCIVHSAKPAICAMFPIGRYMVSEYAPGADAGKTQYFFTNPKCGDDSETQTVREWLGAFGIPVEDEFFMGWQKTAIELVKTLTEMEHTLGRETMDIVWTAVFAGLYLNYKTDEDFMPQFNKNVQDVFSMLHGSDTREGGDDDADDSI